MSDKIHEVLNITKINFFMYENKQNFKGISLCSSSIPWF